MITNSDLKIILNAVTRDLCKNANSPLPCMIQLKQRFNKFFNNETFNFFVNHMREGRYQIIKFSNWRQGSDCRQKYIDVKFTDLVDQTVSNGTWNYTSRNCEDKSYYYPDLNWTISHYNHVLLDVPIKSKNNSDITRERLIYSPGARPNLNLELVPQGQNTPPNLPAPPQEPIPGEPGGPGAPEGAGDDLLKILTNPIVLAGLAVGGYFIWKGSK